mgnify:CR=1 FL=1
MSIYNKKPSFDLQKIFASSKKQLIVLALIIVILVLVWLLPMFFSNDPISFSISKNPISNKEQAILKITVSNPSNEIARDVLVQVSAQDKSSISIAPPTKKIAVLDQKREVEFVINPLKQALSGNYELLIQTEINGKKFEKKATISINNSS